MESDSDNFEDLYNDDDARKHDKLVNKVLSLNKTQQLRKPSRTEPTLQISEFNLVKSITGNKGSVQIGELTKPLKDRKSRVKINENVTKANKIAYTLPKPLEKPQADRIRRSVAYEKARLELDRWESVVTSNRVSTNLNFPLNNDVNLEKKEAEGFTKMWRVKSKLEEDLEKVGPKVEAYHIDLEQEKFPLTMKEMLARRKEAAKLRAFQGYKEAKARRQNKIKSKRYHRILKREKVKQQLREFEQLQKTDPELALKKLEEIEKSRAEERFNLRHKSIGKWARNKQTRAKYDKESRQALAQQLTISRDLTQKTKARKSDSEEEEEKEEETIVQIQIDGNNPWINGIKPDQEVTHFFGGYRKYWMEKNKLEQEVKGNPIKHSETTNEAKELERVQEEIENRNLKKKNEEEIENNLKRKKNADSKKNKKVKKVNDLQSTTNWEVEIVDNNNIDSIDHIFTKLENKLEKKKLKNVKSLKNQLKTKTQQSKAKKKNIEKEKIALSLPLQVKKPVLDEELLEVTSNSLEDVAHNKNLKTLKSILISKTKNTESSDIDPEKYMKVKTTNLSTAIPDILTAEENEKDDDTDQRAIISEAFEDDDIVKDFNIEKKTEVEENKPKDINLNLPGWGTWSDSRSKTSKRKRRRFMIKVPRKIPRRDDNKGTLIINEKAQKKIKEHMVSEVPFPFKTVKDFEASMRAPISNTFLPETAYKKLIQPAVTTKMGAIIEPISRDILLNKKE